MTKENAPWTSSRLNPTMKLRFVLREDPKTGEKRRILQQKHLAENNQREVWLDVRLEKES